MNGIWSDNKYVNTAVNVLLFLTGINFLHYGQLILPVICLILFVDRRFFFRVNQPLVFILLCLFGVSFYAFSIRDFYCVMGFTLPMAYYIGCNMNHPSVENVKKVIFLLAVAMGLHVILNSIYEFIVHGKHGFFFSSTHYDVWTREKISNTATAINADLMIGCLYHLLFHEKDRKLKISCLIVFAWSLFYLLVIGRRTPILIMGLAFLLSFLYEVLILKKGSSKLKKSFFLICAVTAVLVLSIVALYAFDLFGLREFMIGIPIIRKFTSGLINDERFTLYVNALKLMPSHLWGKSEISSILGIEVHDFWLDVYDHAGIVSYLLMLGYTFFFVKDVYRILKSEKSDEEFRILLTGVTVTMGLQMFLEPVMSGASLFLIVCILIHGCFGRLLNDE